MKLGFALSLGQARTLQEIVRDLEAIHNGGDFAQLVFDALEAARNRPRLVDFLRIETGVARFMAKEIERWRAVIKSAGVTME